MIAADVAQEEGASAAEHSVAAATGGSLVATVHGEQAKNEKNGASVPGAGTLGGGPEINDQVWPVLDQVVRAVQRCLRCGERGMCDSVGQEM